MDAAALSCISLAVLIVMGQNLALNIAKKGFPISVYNSTASKVDETVACAIAEGALPLSGHRTPCDFVLSLRRPRSVIIFVKADALVDQTIAALFEFMEPDDAIIDGGNEWYENTERRIIVVSIHRRPATQLAALAAMVAMAAANLHAPLYSHRSTLGHFAHGRTRRSTSSLPLLPASPPIVLRCGHLLPSLQCSAYAAPYSTRAQFGGITGWWPSEVPPRPRPHAVAPCAVRRPYLVLRHRLAHRRRHDIASTHVLYVTYLAADTPSPRREPPAAGLPLACITTRLAPQLLASVVPPLAHSPRPQCTQPHRRTSPHRSFRRRHLARASVRPLDASMVVGQPGGAHGAAAGRPPPPMPLNAMPRRCNLGRSDPTQSVPGDPTREYY